MAGTPAAPFRDQLRQDVGASIKLLHAVIAHVHHIHGTVRRINGDPARKIKLPVVAAEAAPLHDKLAGVIKLLHSEIRTVHHVDVAPHPVHCDAPGRVELPFPVPARAELHQILAQLAVEFLDAVVVRIHHEHVPLGIARDPGWVVEIGVGRPEISPQHNKVADVVEFLDTVVAVVHHEQGSLLVNGDPVHRTHELATVQQRGSAARLSPFRHAQVA